MRPVSNQQLVKSFIKLIKESDSIERKQAIYDAAYAYAIVAGRDFVKFQPMFFMSFIESESGFKPQVSYGYQGAEVWKQNDQYLN